MREKEREGRIQSLDLRAVMRTNKDNEINDLQTL